MPLASWTTKQAVCRPRAHRIDLSRIPEGRSHAEVRALRCLILLLMTTLPGEAPAQAPPSPFAAIYPGLCETPVGERTGDAGCYLLATEPVDGLSETVYWHLYTYSTRAIAKRHGRAMASQCNPWQSSGVYNRRPTMETCEWRARGGHRGPSIFSAVPDTRRGILESIMPPA